MNTKKDEHTLVDICDQVGVAHVQVTEVFRRIARVVLEQNAKVITQEVGTFYCRASKSRTRRLNGVDIVSPAMFSVGVRGKSFPQSEIVQAVGSQSHAGSEVGIVATTFEVEGVFDPPRDDVLSDLLQQGVRAFGFFSRGIVALRNPESDASNLEVISRAGDGPDVEFDDGFEFRNLKVKFVDRNTDRFGDNSGRQSVVVFGGMQVPVDGQFHDVSEGFVSGTIFEVAFPDDDPFVDGSDSYTTVISVTRLSGTTDGAGE